MPLKAIQDHQCRYFIADYCLNFGHFALWAPCGLGATYTVYLRLIGKLVVDFLFVLIELYSLCYGWGATGEYALECRRLRSMVNFGQIFTYSRGRPREPLFVRIDPVNALQPFAEIIHTQKLCIADFLEMNCNFWTENGRFAFMRPPWGLSGNVRCLYWVY